jgi:DNA-binding GntR family transcriptional regulator
MKQPTGLQTPADLEDKENFIWQSLMTAIVEHQLPPGSKLPEEALAEVFGVSRTGIRKVLTRLATVQMVTMTPRRGAFVAKPDIDESKAIFSTRKMIECANLPQVLEHLQPPHIVGSRKSSRRKKRRIRTTMARRRFVIPRHFISSCRLSLAMP